MTDSAKHQRCDVKPLKDYI